jgi:phage regulator Rha-like protein
MVPWEKNIFLTFFSHGIGFSSPYFQPMQIFTIQQMIYGVRGQKIILDFNLAELYEVSTKVLNQAVKRNKARFPEEFMFRLEKEEWNLLKYNVLQRRSQIVTSSQQFRNVFPCAFTEHGVAMLASVLKSEKAIEMNIAIIKAFIALRKTLLQTREVAETIKKIQQTVSNHGEQLKQIYDVIEDLLDDKVARKSWEERGRIGYRQDDNTGML